MLNVRRVLAPNPGVITLEGTNTWVVGADPAIVIDPGPDTDSHLDAVEREAGDVAAVLVTHDHPDHAPGALPFARRVGARVHAYRLAGADPLRGGQRFRAGGVDLTALHTPGHTSDHLAFLDRNTGALFTGDAVLGRGTSFIDPPDGDLAQYLRSLRRMLDLKPRTIYPGHGPIVLRAEEKLRDYLAHREEREGEVVQALAEGPRTIADIVEKVYAGYPKEVHGLAARSVLAHLLKLEHEGRAERTGPGEAGPWVVRSQRACERCGRPVKGRSRYCSVCSLTMLQSGG